MRITNARIFVSNPDGALKKEQLGDVLLEQILSRLDGDICTEAEFQSRGGQWMISGGSGRFILSRCDDDGEWEELINPAVGVDERVEMVIGGQLSLIPLSLLFSAQEVLQVLLENVDA